MRRHNVRYDISRLWIPLFCEPQDALEAQMQREPVCVASGICTALRRQRQLLFGSRVKWFNRLYICEVSSVDERCIIGVTQKGVNKVAPWNCYDF